MSYEEVSPFDLEELKSQLLAVVKPFSLGYKETGYKGMLQDNLKGFCFERLEIGDFVEVTGVMRDDMTLFCKKVDVPVNSMHETLERVDDRSLKNENSLDAVWGVITQLTREQEWIKDQLPGCR